MAFWRKKKPKEEEVKKPEIIRPLFVKITEHTGITEGRLLVVENRSSSPLMNVIIRLSPGTSDLGEEIKYTILKPHEVKQRAFKSDVKAFKHELVYEPPKALAPGDETVFEIKVSSDIPAEGRITIPIRAYSSISYEASSGEVMEGEGLIRAFNVHGEESIKVSVAPNGEEDPRKVGAYKVELYSNDSMSGIKVQEVKAFAQIDVSFEKESLGGNERRVVVNVENPNEFHVSIQGSVTVIGDNREEAVIDELLPPGESKSLVFSVRSVQEPLVQYDLKGVVEGVVEYESVYSAEFEGYEVPLLKGELHVEAKALHDEILRRVLEEKEIPSVGESLAELNIKFVSLGHAEVDSIERETRLEPPIGEFKEVESKHKVEVDTLRKVSLRLKKDESFSATERYRIRPTGNESYVLFHVTLVAKAGEASISLDAEDKLEIRLLRRSVSMSISQGFEDERFVYRVQLINTGQMPAVGVRLVAEIPENEFEVDVEPKEDEKKRNLRRRVFDVIYPNEEKIVKIRVRPISEEASFENIRIYQERVFLRWIGFSSPSTSTDAIRASS